MGQGARTPVQAKTVAQAVYESLRRSILDGTLPAGARLTQDELAGQLGVSRMPVREALGRLEAEGMIVFETYRGGRVAPLTLAEADQLYLMRIALEPLLARLGAEGLDAASIAGLEGAVEALAVALAAGNADALFEQVRAFHETLYAAAGKPLVLNQVLGLRDLAQRYIRRYLALPGRLAHAVENHRQLLDALRARRPDVVERLIREELAITRDALLTSLAAA